MDAAAEILRSSQNEMQMTFDFSGTVFKQQSDMSNFVSNLGEHEKFVQAFDQAKIIQYEETDENDENQEESSSNFIHDTNE